jgi:hypothetical protein
VPGGDVAGRLAQTLTQTYVLDDIWLLPDITRPWESAQPLTGSFEWTYEAGDFENGSGRFIDLWIPWYDPGLEALNINVDLTSIEVTLPGSFHDLGVDLTVFLLEPLSPDRPAAVDTDRSAFEIQQGIIYQGHVVSGSIVPDPCDCPVDWQLFQDVSASAGQVQLDFEIGSPDASFFATYLILIDPQLQVIPLWAIPIPAIDPPALFPISSPLPVSGTVGFYSGLISNQGVRDFDLDWNILR